MTSNPSLEQVEWSQNIPLHHLLPYVFENGLKFNGFNAQCSGCNGYISSNNLHGFLNKIGNNRCLLTAHGLCTECNGFTTYTFMLTAGEHLTAEYINTERRRDN